MTRPPDGSGEGGCEGVGIANLSSPEPAAQRALQLMVTAGS
jgi:hypothetical protein